MNTLDWQFAAMDCICGQAIAVDCRPFDREVMTREGQSQPHPPLSSPASKARPGTQYAVSSRLKQPASQVTGSRLSAYAPAGMTTEFGDTPPPTTMSATEGGTVSAGSSGRDSNMFHSLKAGLGALALSITVLATAATADEITTYVDHGAAIGGTDSAFV